MRHLLLIIASLLCLSSCGQSNKSTMDQKKILVAYFSATGTTERVAKAIADATGATLYEITPELRFTTDDLNWNDPSSRSSLEMHDPDSRPAIANTDGVNAADYDLIFIGYPIWWDLAPRQVNTWIESQKLDGKRVVPFATSGGSSIRGSVRDLKRLYPSIDWQEGRLLNGSPKSASDWAKSID
ncbi:MAG: flavodoxin [Bacteroidales bacterium]|nr:flavodoxin [Bacteroidales bacterium]